MEKVDMEKLDKLSKFFKALAFGGLSLTLMAVILVAIFDISLIGEKPNVFQAIIDGSIVIGTGAYYLVSFLIKKRRPEM